MPIRTRTDVPIAQLTTFQNAGTVKEVVVLESLQDARHFLSLKLPFYVLGKGSNVLINPEGSHQRFVQISPGFSNAQVSGTQLKISAGTPVNILMKLLQEHGLSGLEFSAGVPASIGGMVAMNFGCWGEEVSKYIENVHVLDLQGNSVWLTQKEMDFSYRHSRIQTDHFLVVEVILNLRPENPEIIKSKILENIKTRSDKQPLRDKTFGSTFKNPAGHFAGALIEKAGFKGKAQGDVKFSDKHANFMVNNGEGTFHDAFTLIQNVQYAAQHQLNVTLETEVKLIS
jgi:UDP-N-acetylmuramate dehydrogenase